MTTDNDTIAAVSTAPGEGGIGIVRISGDKAAEILGNIFSICDRDGANLHSVFSDKKMYYGHIVEPASKETVDEVLVVLMKGPHSYTGEDVAEIQCHGGSIPLMKILDIVISLGAVPAQPGEFTKRAFLNGRIDLVQAGAVIDLIRSKTVRGYHSAKEQAEGRLSEKVKEIREILLVLLAEIAVRIDYPDEFEQEDKNNRYELVQRIQETESLINQLLEGAEAGRIIRDGIRVAIIGKPNTGKSSLFNALSKEDAAIVTSMPGTTRDAIEIWLNVRGIPVLLSDTAGIRDSSEEIETLGIERAKDQYQRADISIFLLDGSIPLSKEDFDIAKNLDEEKKHIIVINKTDLPQVFGEKEITDILPFQNDYKNNIVRLSLIDDEAGKMNKGIKEIENMIEAFVMRGVSSGSSLLVTKARHKTMLETAALELREAGEILSEDSATEFAEVNIRAAWDVLGEMIGERATDDVIERVFEEFCVGK